MKRNVPLFFLILFFLTGCSGCKIIRIEEEAAQPVKYTIVTADTLPPDALELIEEKKQEEFEMTYQRGKDLYLIKGYGQQMTGGYSIQVKGLTASSTGIFFKTCLFGPKEKPQHSTPSYPFIAVKMAYQDLPVQFETVLCSSEKIN